MTQVRREAPSGLGIALHGASARLGLHTALQGVSLRTEPGQWLAVVGPNGAGKSTLLRCLAGLQRLSEGRRVSPSGSMPHAGKGAPPLAWLPQSPPFDEAMTVQDTVGLGRLPQQGWWGLRSLQPDAADRHAVTQALQDTDLAWAAARRMGELSGGERQRAALARALATQAACLLLDEPAAHLDAPHQRLLARVLARQAGQGACVVSVLHELPLALMADSLAVMQSGRLVAQGRRDDPDLHRQIEAVFDHALRIVQIDGQWTSVPCL